MPVNVKLLKKVRKLIAEEPRRVRMHGWGLQRTKKQVRADKTMPPCGTQACLAGWTILAARPSVRKQMTPKKSLLGVLADRDQDPGNEAAKLLGIDIEDCPFSEVGWEAPEVLAWIDRQIDAASK